MNIGYYAPPPGSHTGVADYAETLRVALNAIGVATVASGGAVDIYHLGNNALHSEIYSRSLERPGVVILHDAVLQHFYLGRLSRDEYIAEFVYNYGEWSRHLAEELWSERSGSAVDPRYFEYPMLRRAMEASRAVVVHNPAAARVALSHSAPSVHVIPHFVTPRPAPDHAAAAGFRNAHGVPQQATVFGIFGYLRETKRVLPSLKAFRRLHAVRPNVALLLAGEAVSTDLARLLETEALHPAIYRAGFLTEDEFDSATAAIDCCLNLRYPGAGETSGVTVRMAAAGTPLIVTGSEECASLPVTSCLRVRPGVAEAEELFDHMTLVAEFPSLARAMGNEARRHMEKFHSLHSVAQQYRDLLCAIGS